MKKIYLSRRESIVLTAIDIINEMGIHELSLREIAKREEISEPALYRHFRNKEAIILGVLAYYSKFDKMIINTIEERRLQGKEAILFFLKSYGEYHENYPALTAIPFSFSLTYEPSFRQQIIKIYNTRWGAVNNYIMQGKAMGEIDKDISNEALIHAIVGLESSIILRWRLENYSFSIRDKIMEGLKVVI